MQVRPKPLGSRAISRSKKFMVYGMGVTALAIGLPAGASVAASAAVPVSVSNTQTALSLAAAAAGHNTTGEYAVTKKGAVLQHTKIYGSISVKADNVHIEHLSVYSSRPVVIEIPSNVHGTVIDNVTINCLKSGATAAGPGQFTMTNAVLNGCGTTQAAASAKPSSSSTTASSALSTPFPGAFVVSKAGTFVQHRIINSSISVQANNVHIAHLTVNSSDSIAIQIPAYIHGTVIDSVTINCKKKGAAVAGPGSFTMTHAVVNGCGPALTQSSPSAAPPVTTQPTAPTTVDDKPVIVPSPVVTSSSPTPTPTHSTPAPSPTPTYSSTPTPTQSSAPTSSAPTSSAPAPTASKGCLAKPSACGYPDATNTGARGTLTPSGTIKSTTDGQVIKNLDITGYIQVTSANVTIENVRITGGNLFGAIDLHNATGHTTITDVTVISTSAQLAGMTIRNATITRANISGGQDGIDAWGGLGPNVVRDSYIHNLGRNTAIDSHDDTIQTSGGDETFTHNTLLPFDGTDPMNSCLQIGDLQGSLSQLTFSNNLCDGGNYSINANANNVKLGKVTAGPLTFAGNRFGRDYRYGVKTNLGSPFSTSWSGNVDDATGNAV